MRSLAAGYKPDVIVGDMDSVSDRTLQSGAELVVHAYPGRPRARAGAGSTGSASLGGPADARASARTWRCCSPTRRAPS